jgi:magnesium transporter
VIVDCAIYEGGFRREGPLDLEEALSVAAGTRTGFVWIGVHEPTEGEFEGLAQAFKLHPLAVEDAVHAHQRPKLDVYGNTLFVVLKTARYVDPVEIVEIGQLMLFLGENFVVTVRHGAAAALADVRHELEADPERLGWGPAAVLHAVADRVVDEYGAVARGLDNDVDEIESQVFSDDRQNHAQRIYKLKREVLQFRRAVSPLVEPIDALARGRLPLVGEKVKPYFRDVQDHLLREAEHVEGLDTLLTGALNANLANVGVRQNEDMRKISAWVAIVAVPTMIAGIYGMNFESMPELEWLLGYPFALGLMVVCGMALYRSFRHRGWL